MMNTNPLRAAAKAAAETATSKEDLVRRLRDEHGYKGNVVVHLKKPGDKGIITQFLGTIWVMLTDQHGKAVPITQ